MSDFVLTLALRSEGLNDQQIAQVQAAIPTFQRLLNMAVADKDTLLALATLLTKLQPLLLEGAKDWQTLGPVAKIVTDAVAKW